MLTVVIITIVTMIPLLHAYLAYISTICKQATCPIGQPTPQAIQALQAVGLSADGFVTYTLILTFLALLMCWLVAAVITWRKSDDWMALLVALMLVLMGTSYVTHLVLQQPSVWQVPALLLDIFTFGIFFLVFCLFPNGRFVPSWSRWLPVGWVIWGLITLSIREVPGFFSFHLTGFVVGLMLIICSQVYRYRHISTMSERQQTKWVVWGASIAMMSVVLVSLPVAIFPALIQQNWLYCLLDAPALTLALFLGAISIGMAILRTRLWDIDILINLTLVYSGLSVCLALIYVVLVITLQFLLQRIFNHTSDITLVASTLATVALFQPLRRQIQRSIDRRFYRHKYDAVNILEAYGARLRSREDIELNVLAQQLQEVVEETMHPTHVSLWLRPNNWEKNLTTRPLPMVGEVSD